MAHAIAAIFPVQDSIVLHHGFKRILAKHAEFAVLQVLAEYGWRATDSRAKSGCGVEARSAARERGLRRRASGPLLCNTTL